MNRIVVIVLAAASFGCGAPLEVTSVRTGPPLAAKPPATPVPVYFNQRPPRPYREVGQIRVRSRSSLERVLEAAAAEAREIGADALIMDVRAGYRSLEVTIDCEGRPHVDGPGRVNARAMAVVFVPSGAAQTEGDPSGPPPVDGCAGARAR